MRSERDTAHGFFPLPTAQDLLHRTFQIVVTEHTEHPTKIVEAELMALQERLLVGMQVGAMKRPGAGHAAQAKHKYVPLLALDFRQCFIPVHLPFLPPSIRLGTKDFLAELPQLQFAFPHISPHRAFPDFCLRSFHPQAAPYAVSGMALLARRSPVRFQNRVNKIHHRHQLGLLANGTLTLGGHGVG